MTDKEFIRALRLCSCETNTRNCPTCPLSGNDDCVTDALRGAADLIERLTAENVVLPDGKASAIESLRKEIEWKDMVIALAQRKQAEAEAERDALLEIAKNGKDCDTCKNCAVCVKPGTDVAHWCDRCEEKCRCYGCGGDHWEWRGLPEAPEEDDT